MKKVLLIYGGTSCEHDVSCVSAKYIIDNIDRKKYKLDCVYITKSNDWIYENRTIDNIIGFLKNYDVVFPITHGKDGEDGKLQGMLDYFKIKYVGCNWGSSYICMDKKRTKEIISSYKIPQVPYEIYSKKITIPFPVIVKPANSGSSYGITTAKNKNELKKAVKVAKEYDKNIIIEKLIKPKELECAVIYDKKWIISEIGEIKYNNSFYDYKTKYKNKETKYIIPAEIDNNTKKIITDYVKQIIKILDIKSFARIDFFYDTEYKKIYFNEVNTLPGFTEISMFPKLLLQKGYTHKNIITSLIESVYNK